MMLLAFLIDILRLLLFMSPTNLYLDLYLD